MAERVGTNIVEVDPEQDLTELVYRLRELPGDGALSIPPGAQRFQTDESLQVVKRQAVSTGRRIAVITTDADIQARARAAGLEAFVDRAAYEASEAPPPAPPVKRSARARPGFRPDRRLAAAAGGLVVIALGAAAIAIPTATVTLSVAGTPVQADAPLVGFPGNYDATFLGFNTHTLAADASQSQSAPATGRRPVPAVAATGEVVLTATSCGSPILVPAGTIVQTADGKQYATGASVTLCAPSASGNTQVAAVVAGNAGNVPAYSLISVPSLPSITVTNPDLLSGGADPRTATFVQQADVDALRQQLISTADAAVRSQLAQQVGLSHMIVSSYPQFSAQISPPVGAEADTVSVTLTETLKAVAYSDPDVHARLREAIKVRVPPGFALTRDPIKTWYEVTAATEDGHVALSGHGLAYAMPVFDAAAITRAITGHTLGSARDRLGRLPDVVHIDISQRPFPLPWLPMRASHVFIDVFETPTSRA